VKVKKGKNINLSHLYEVCEKLESLWVLEDGRTPRTHFINKPIKQNVSIENVAYPFIGWWCKTRYDRSERVSFVCQRRRWSNLPTMM